MFGAWRLREASADHSIFGMAVFASLNLASQRGTSILVTRAYLPGTGHALMPNMILFVKSRLDYTCSVRAASRKSPFILSNFRKNSRVMVIPFLFAHHPACNQTRENKSDRPRVIRQRVSQQVSCCARCPKRYRPAAGRPRPLHQSSDAGI
jgi:hypothetical protein